MKWTLTIVYKELISVCNTRATRSMLVVVCGDTTFRSVSYQREQA